MAGAGRTTGVSVRPIMKLPARLLGLLLLLGTAPLAFSKADCGSQPYCCPPGQQFPCNHGPQKPQDPVSRSKETTP